MKKANLFLRIIGAGVLSTAIMSICCIPYAYNTLGIRTQTGASDYVHEPGSLYTNTKEGYMWSRVDSLGYNNVKTYDDVDVLIMGGSHIEAIQMSQEDAVTYKLDQMLPDLNVYNVATSGHNIAKCVAHLENACEYFKPQYVILHLTGVEIDKSQMESVLNGELEEAYLKSSKRLIKFVRNNVPIVGNIGIQIGLWQDASIGRLLPVISKNELSEDGSDISTNNLSLISDNYMDLEYLNTLSAFIGYASDICKSNDCQLIILYNPAGYELNEDADVIYFDSDEELEMFKDICDEHDVVVCNTKPIRIDMYNQKHLVSRGFSNTSPNSGHFNKYGHTAMAHALYDTITELENDRK